MKKILAVTNNPLDGAAICRVNAFKTLGAAKSLITNTPSWKQVADSDVIFVHRPVKESDFGLIELAKKAGKKIWLDIDDDYLNVPNDHSAFSYYQKPEIRENIEKATELSDVITVSNNNLRDKHTEKTFLTACSYSGEYLKKLNQKFPKKQLRVCWRGSQTHRKSLLEYGPQIVSLSIKNPEWEWYFLGDSPWMFSNEMKAKKIVVNPDWLDTDTMLNYIQAISPAIQIMPLTDNHFTRSRSNMAWMDGLTGGAVTIAPNWEHWKVPGVINYESKEDFEAKTSKAMQDIENGISFDKEVKAGWDHMLENYTFEAINKVQEKVLQFLFPQGELK